VLVSVKVQRGQAVLSVDDEVLALGRLQVADVVEFADGVEPQRFAVNSSTVRGWAAG